MKPVLRLLGRHDGDIAWEHAVQGEWRALRRRAGGGAEARHLGERVDSRVGPARNGETRPAGKDLVERGSKRALHGSLLRLGRPAREIGSVVFERQLEGRHGSIFADAASS
jgi:hypothetical protein